ncbi:MarR family winged helix-turn-helix transcriptional regulator [Emcibacter sp.]|uniref:MarR family winged helix-turn-helix transcriptional regulator n=1 Tax=Emcibacter sp. TaxID=1979954 RepID=UPI002AA7389C|nr:MarR family winged helix-turn-helix transcriptional regulator [Emcibacter sp.]
MTVTTGMDAQEKMLVALRRIIRATDLHSKRMARETGLTLPQLLLMQAAHGLGDVTVGQLAQEMNLTQATITTIVDRLAKADMVYRERDTVDKRKVFVRLTDKGRTTLIKAPPALQDKLSTHFSHLDEWEQNFILAALQRVARLMDAESLDASPVLDVGEITRSDTMPTSSTKTPD